MARTARIKIESERTTAARKQLYALMTRIKRGFGSRIEREADQVAAFGQRMRRYRTAGNEGRKQALEHLAARLGSARAARVTLERIEPRRRASVLKLWPFG